VHLEGVDVSMLALILTDDIVSADVSQHPSNATHGCGPLFTPCAEHPGAVAMHASASMASDDRRQGLGADMLPLHRRTFTAPVTTGLRGRQLQKQAP
jgi:hypothetical protein